MIMMYLKYMRFILICIMYEMFQLNTNFKNFFLQIWNYVGQDNYKVSLESISWMHHWEIVMPR